MNTLNPFESELVALGAALASNCVPCIEFHIPEARKAGLTDAQISEAIHLADKVRKVPARKVLDTALGLIQDAGQESADEKAGYGSSSASARDESGFCCG